MTLNLPARPSPELLLDHDARPAGEAYRLVHDALRDAGDPRMNLATFTTTWMEPEAGLLLSESAAVNLADGNTAGPGRPGPPVLELERSCLRTIARLWHAPDPASVVGCSTVGSSEACLLAGLALKRRWQTGRAGRTGGRPNLVLGTSVQVCWLKFCNYWDVEARFVEIDDDLLLDPAGAAAACDADTIGVVAVLGSTLDGAYDPVADLAAHLDALTARGGPDVSLHVDAAFGGLIAPFLDPHVRWDFAVPRVASINTSGHKYGMVYPGLGWALWRDPDALPADLVLSLNYLGGDLQTFGLNFSRPGAGVIGQYYEFVREGFDGIRAIHADTRRRAGQLAERLGRVPGVVVRGRGGQVPVVTFAVTPSARVDGYGLSRALHERGWQVPAYALPGRHAGTVVLRAVCRRDLDAELAERLVDDVRAIVGP